jgi:hypothetical protein
VEKFFEVAPASPEARGRRRAVEGPVEARETDGVGKSSLPASSARQFVTFLELCAKDCSMPQRGPSRRAIGAAPAYPCQHVLEACPWGSAVDEVVRFREAVPA